MDGWRSGVGLSELIYFTLWQGGRPAIQTHYKNICRFCILQHLKGWTWDPKLRSLSFSGKHWLEVMFGVSPERRINFTQEEKNHLLWFLVISVIYHAARLLLDRPVDLTDACLPLCMQQEVERIVLTAVKILFMNANKYECKLIILWNKNMFIITFFFFLRSRVLDHTSWKKSHHLNLILQIV